MTNNLPQSQTTVAIGYLRVSTERQATEDRTSLADQQAAITRKALALGVGIARWYRDEGASGATVEGRPAFSQMLADCLAAPRSARAPGLVLVLNDARFGRFPDPDEAAALRFRLKQAGWLVRFCEGDDSEDVTARSIMRALGSAQASEYRANLSRNSRRGRRGTALQGFWGTRAPIGYRRAVVQPAANARVLEAGQLKAPNERVKLVPHAEEAELVRWIFEQYADGHVSLGSLERKLLTRHDGKRWSRGVLHQLLTNRAYVGDVVGGRRRADATSDVYVAEDAHPAIVSRELFDRVQRRLGTNAKAGRAVTAPNTHLLSSIMRCAQCGQFYTAGGTGGWIRGADGERVRVHHYLDNGSRPPRVCPGRMGTVSTHLADAAVLTTLARTIASPAIRNGIEAEVDRALSAGVGTAGESLAALRNAKKRAEQKRERLIATIADGVLLQSEAATQLERIRAELAELDARTQAARFSGRRAGAETAKRDALVQAALDFPKAIKKLTGAALRDSVHPWLESLTFDKSSRMIEMAIRRAPFASLHLSHSAGRDGRQQGRRDVLIRRVAVGPRRAGGAR